MPFGLGEVLHFVSDDTQPVMGMCVGRMFE